AKEEQSFVETRIAQVEKMIRYAVIIENDTKSDGIVDIGKSVTFKELPDGEEETYTIVGSAEADPFEGKISNDSPIAKSTIGKEENTDVMVATPCSESKVKIIKVEYILISSRGLGSGSYNYK